MAFGDPYQFVWFWLLIPLAVLLWFSYRQRKMRLSLFSKLTEIRLLTWQQNRSSYVHKSLLVVLGVASLVLALTKPRYGFEWVEVKQSGVDIMIALDVSRSMLAEDVNPNRLERAKREIKDLLQILTNDRVGLIAFAGSAFVHCPLTSDYAALRMFVDYLDTELISVQGTALGEAIILATKSLKESSPDVSRGKAMILITDGEDQGTEPIEKAQQAKDQLIKIFAIGVGSSSGAPIPLKEGGFKKDKSGQVVLTKLEESTLMEIAKNTDGMYVRSETGDLDLDRIYNTGIKENLEESEFESTKTKLWHERFQWFLMIAFLCLVWEFFLPLKKQPLVTSLLVMMFYLLSHGGHLTADTLKQAHNDYESGQYSEAADKFLKHEVEHPDDLATTYNRAVSQHKAGQYQQAKQGFSKSSQSADDKLAAQSYYNLGHAEVATGDLEKAKEAFEHALAKDSSDLQAKENLEWVKQMLEQQKQQNKQQSPQDQKKDDQQQQNADQQKSNNSEQQQQSRQNNKPQQMAQNSDQTQEQNSGADQKSDLTNNEKPFSSEKDSKSISSESLPGTQTMPKDQAELLLRSVPDQVKKYLHRRQKVSPRSENEKDW